MGHCIQAIVAPTATVDAILTACPELSRLDRRIGFSIFPVEAELIDRKIAPDSTPTATGNEFMLLTDGFRHLLRSLSADGVLAYVESEYFGGTAVQGALVCRKGEEVLPPKWAASGSINEPLQIIGVPRSLLADRFSVIGFDQVRNNDELLELIAARAPNDE